MILNFQLLTCIILILHTIPILATLSVTSCATLRSSSIGLRSCTSSFIWAHCGPWGSISFKNVGSVFCVYHSRPVQLKGYQVQVYMVSSFSIYTDCCVVQFQYHVMLHSCYVTFRFSNCSDMNFAGLRCPLICFSVPFKFPDLNGIILLLKQ